ncbi:MAG: hypothetical protein WBC91_12175 [Phototrophicaceae bacterium]
MPDKNFHELLGDDGEFIDAVDERFGVYSVHRRGYWWRLSATIASAIGVVAVVIGFIWFG